MTAINTTYKILNFVSEITSTDFITGMKEQCPAAFWQPSTITTIYTGHKQETKKANQYFPGGGVKEQRDGRLSL